MRIGEISSKTTRDTMASTATALTVCSNRTSSNGGSGKDGCSDDMPSAESRRYIEKLLCYGCEQKREKKLL